MDRRRTRSEMYNTWRSRSFLRTKFKSKKDNAPKKESIRNPRATKTTNIHATSMPEIVEKVNIPKKRGRPKKCEMQNVDCTLNSTEPVLEVDIPKKRGRPKKCEMQYVDCTLNSTEPVLEVNIPKKRGRPKKCEMQYVDCTLNSTEPILEDDPEMTCELVFPEQFPNNELYDDDPLKSSQLPTLEKCEIKKEEDEVIIIECDSDNEDVIPKESVQRSLIKDSQLSNNEELMGQFPPLLDEEVEGSSDHSATENMEMGSIEEQPSISLFEEYADRRVNLQDEEELGLNFRMPMLLNGNACHENNAVFPNLESLAIDDTLRVMFGNELPSAGKTILNDSLFKCIAIEVLQSSINDEDKSVAVKRLLHGNNLFVRIQKKDSSITNLSSCFSTSYIYTVLDAIKEICENNEQEVCNTSLVDSLSWFFNIAGTELIKGYIWKFKSQQDRNAKIRDINIFLEIIKRSWNTVPFLKKINREKAVLATTNTGFRDIITPTSEKLNGSPEITMRKQNISFINYSLASDSDKESAEIDLVSGSAETTESQDPLLVQNQENSIKIVQLANKRLGKVQCRLCKQIVSNLSSHLLSSHKDNKLVKCYKILLKDHLKTSKIARMKILHNLKLNKNNMLTTSTMFMRHTEGNELHKGKTYILKNSLHDKKPQYYRKTYCSLCKTVVTKFISHLLRKHGDNETVIRYKALLKERSENSKKLRLIILKNLQLKGNNVNDRALLKKQNLESTCVPLVKKRNPTNHLQNAYPKYFGVDLVGSCVPDIARNNKIINMVQKDLVTQDSLKDKLFMSVIKSYCIENGQFQKQDNNKDYEKYIFNKIKFGCNLLLNLKEKDSSIQGLSDCFDPLKKEILLETIKEMCEFNETTENIGVPSMPPRLLHFLNDVIVEAARDIVVYQSESKEVKTEWMKSIDEILKFLRKCWQIVKYQISKEIRHKESNKARLYSDPVKLFLGESPKFAKAQTESMSLSLESKFVPKRKQDFCIFCKKLKTNFYRHLMSKHENEKEVVQLKSLQEKGAPYKEERIKLYNEFRLHSNNVYNQKILQNPVLREKVPLLSRKMRKYPLGKEKSLDDLVICSFCKGIFIRTCFSNHIKRCFLKRNYDSSLTVENLNPVLDHIVEDQDDGVIAINTGTDLSDEEAVFPLNQINNDATLSSEQQFEFRKSIKLITPNSNSTFKTTSVTELKISEAYINQNIEEKNKIVTKEGEGSVEFEERRVTVEEKKINCDTSHEISTIGSIPIMKTKKYSSSPPPDQNHIIADNRESEQETGVSLNAITNNAETNKEHFELEEYVELPTEIFTVTDSILSTTTTSEVNMHESYCNQNIQERNKSVTKEVEDSIECEERRTTVDENQINCDTRNEISTIGSIPIIKTKESISSLSPVENHTIANNPEGEQETGISLNEITNNALTAKEQFEFEKYVELITGIVTVSDSALNITPNSEPYMSESYNNPNMEGRNKTVTKEIEDSIECEERTTVDEKQINCDTRNEISTIESIPIIKTKESTSSLSPVQNHIIANNPESEQETGLSLNEITNNALTTKEQFEFEKYVELINGIDTVSDSALKITQNSELQMSKSYNSQNMEERNITVTKKIEDSIECDERTTVDEKQINCDTRNEISAIGSIPIMKTKESTSSLSPVQNHIIAINPEVEQEKGLSLNEITNNALTTKGQFEFEKYVELNTGIATVSDSALNNSPTSEVNMSNSYSDQHIESRNETITKEVDESMECDERTAVDEKQINCDTSHKISTIGSIPKIKTTKYSYVLKEYNSPLCPAPNPLPEASTVLREMVLSQMKHDEVSKVALNDPLLMATASELVEKSRTSKESNLVMRVVRLIRDGGKLLLHIQAHDKEITQFRDILKPSNINSFFEATKELCGLDEKTGEIKQYQMPFRISYVITQAAAQIFKEASMNSVVTENDDEIIKKEVNEFLEHKRTKFRSIIVRWPALVKPKKLPTSSKSDEESNHSNSDTETEESDSSSSSSERFGTYNSHAAKKRRAIALSEFEENSSDKEDSPAVECVNGKKLLLGNRLSTHTHQKKRWSEKQKQLVIHEFKEFIIKGTNPGRKRCRDLIASSCELAGRSADQVNLMIDNINKGKLKLPKEFEYLKMKH